MSVTTDDRRDWGSERMELAAMRGHPEARERLKDAGRSEEWVQRVEDACESYVEFARVVADVEADERGE